MGTIGAAAVAAKLAFVVLLALGVARGDLSYRIAAVIVLVAVAVIVGLPLLPSGGPLVITALAIIDIVLVLVVFKGDIRI